VRAIRRFTVRTVLPEPLAPLSRLALNLRWAWHGPTRDLFASMDRDLWQEVGHDPAALLGALGPARLAELADSTPFVRRVEQAAADLDEYLTGPRWYQSLPDDGPSARPAMVAYFSPEFGITATLPQYSGGLGVLAGDHLKAASDLGLPVIGVGLLYTSGYFEQSLTREGWQLERYPVLDPDGQPLSLVREPDGSPAYVRVGLPGGRTLSAHIWRAQVGRVPLLLLDSDVEDNDDAARRVTDRLYGGGGEHRLHQEMLLGIGGVRAIRTFCRISGLSAPEVFHTNEGHAGFLGVERMRELVTDEGLTFAEALEAVRAGTVFTTHTPVPAGIDRFSRDLIAQHFGGDNAVEGIPLEDVLELGRESYPGGDPSVFNMAVMGLRLAQRANGVSRLHGHVSRQMFAGLWPGFDVSEVPITSVTNGVHATTWVDDVVLGVAERLVGPRLVEGGRDWEAIEAIDDATIWATRRRLRAGLVDEARRRLRASWLARGASPAELGWIDSALDPDVLTIGFARRVPSYKRLTLMLTDPDRLRRILLDPDRPVQIIVAGKSHPADDAGKKLIQELVAFSDDPAVRHRMVFLPNYDMAMARALYPGCDVWLNNPLRPLEACGTSGMKAALNGALNLSVLDGWWDEWYDGDNGWAIPTAEGVDDPTRRDELEAQGLYELLENVVAPRFYDRDRNGRPAKWLSMVRHTLVTLGPKVQATRMVREYVHALYTPAAASARTLDGPGYATARRLAAWKARVRAGWGAVRVDHVEATGLADAPELGATFGLRVFVSLGELAPTDVDVQVVHGRVGPDDELTDTQSVILGHAASYEGGRHRYEGDLKLDRTGPFGYTVRILPRHELLAHPAELGLVTYA
jgi:starch phosphorylase